jgi:hypothetical protein
VTFTLEPEGTGTRLFLAHDGFDPDDPYQVAGRRFMGGGWPDVLRRVAGVIEETPPASADRGPARPQGGVGFSLAQVGDHKRFWGHA